MFISASLISPLVVILLVCVVAQIIFIIGVNRRMTRQSKMLRQFFSGPQGEDLEMLLTRTLENARTAEEAARTTSQQMKELLVRFDGCVQHFALVRYDAFDDVTGQLSFSLAMLDGRDNGAVISTIYGRSNSRCFGKMIVEGRPEQPLTEEEQQALIQAVAAKASKKPQSNNSHKMASLVSEAHTNELVGAPR